MNAAALRGCLFVCLVFYHLKEMRIKSKRFGPVWGYTSHIEETLSVRPAIHPSLLMLFVQNAEKATLTC